jgi:chitin synthase
MLLATAAKLKHSTFQVCASYLAYIFGKFGCKVNIQRASFALPLNLATPAAVAILIGLCKIRSELSSF